jgi:hypothetical protein
MATTRSEAPAHGQGSPAAARQERRNRKKEVELEARGPILLYKLRSMMTSIPTPIIRIPMTVIWIAAGL